MPSYHDPRGNYQVQVNSPNINCQFAKTCNTYVHIGFGEMDNFVEDLVVYLPGLNDYDKTMNQIIPNTQVKMYLAYDKPITWSP